MFLIACRKLRGRPAFMRNPAVRFDYLSANEPLELPVKIASVAQAVLNERYRLDAMASPRKVRMKRSIMVFMFA